MLSFRDIVATPDDADVLWTSLEELRRRRREKPLEGRVRERREDSNFLDEATENWGTAEEIAYRREVLNTWAQRYPMLREAVASSATASLSSTATISLQTTPEVFTVTQIIRRPYPPLWEIPAYTVPSEFFRHDTAMDNVSQQMSTPQSQHTATGAMKDYSADSCLVRILWEALQSAEPSRAPPQRVLARWPRGKPTSAKAAAVLRSIRIEERRRDKMSEELRLQQRRDEMRHGCSTAPTIHFEDPITGVNSASRPTQSAVEDESYAVPAEEHPGIGGSSSDATETFLGYELYWPAYITRVRALFTGAACLQDTLHGLDALERYEHFEAVLALALESPLRLVVDVVYIVDETSETIGLSIDPVVCAAPTSSAADLSLVTHRDTDGLRSTSHADLAPPRTVSAVAEDACRPLLLPSSLPQVLSDRNYAFTIESVAADNSVGDAAATASGGGRASLRRTASKGGAYVRGEPTVSAAVLRRSALSSSPKSLYTILAGPVSQTHSIVLLRPTPALVCAARAQALQELEQRWRRLRQTLVAQPEAREEQTPLMTRLQSPVAATPPPGSTTSLSIGSPTAAGALVSYGSLQLPSYVVSMKLPDVDTPAPPFIDCSVRPDQEPPTKPIGAKSLTEEEMRRQTQLPKQQQPHDLSGRRRRLPTVSPISRSPDPGLRVAERAHSHLSCTMRSPCGPGTSGDEDATSPPPPAAGTPRSLCTPRSDRTAKCINDTTSTMVGGDDPLTTPMSGLRSARAADEAQRGTLAWCTGGEVISFCSPVSPDRLHPQTDFSFTHLGWLHSGPSSERHWGPTAESGTIAAAAPLPTHTLRLSSDLDPVDGSAATAARASLSSAPPPQSRRSHLHNGDLPEGDDVANSGQSIMLNGMTAYSAILSASVQSIPESQAMTALQTAGLAANPLGSTRHRGNDAVLSERSTVGVEHAATLSGQIKVMSSTLPLRPNHLAVAQPRHVAPFSEEETLAMPISRGTPCTMPVRQCSAMSTPASPPSDAASPHSEVERARVRVAVTQPHAELINHTSPPNACYLASLPPSAPSSFVDNGGSCSTNNNINIARKRSVMQPPLPSLELPPQRTPWTSKEDDVPSTLGHESPPGNKHSADRKETEVLVSPVTESNDAHAGSTRLAPHTTASVSPTSDSDSAALSGTASYSERCQTGSPSPSLSLRDQHRLQLRNLGRLQQSESLRRVSPQRGHDIHASNKAHNPMSDAARVQALSRSVVVTHGNPQRSAQPPRHRSRNAARRGFGGQERQDVPVHSDAGWLSTAADEQHRIVQGNSRGPSSGEETRCNSPLPHSPPSLVPSSAMPTVGNNASEVISHHTSAASQVYLPCFATIQPSTREGGEETTSRLHGLVATETDATPAINDDTGNWLQQYRGQQQPQWRQQCTDPISATGSRSVLHASLNHEVELPDAPGCVDEVPPAHTPPLQEPKPYLIAANAPAAASAATEWSSVDLYEITLSNPREKTDREREITFHEPYLSVMEAAHPSHHQQKRTASQSSDPPSPLPKEPRSSQKQQQQRRPFAMYRRGRCMRMKHDESTETGNVDGATAANLLAPRMRHTSPPAAATSSIPTTIADASTSSVSSDEVLACARRTAPRKSSHASRTRRGIDEEVFDATQFWRRSSSEKQSRHHHRVASPSPRPSSTHRHTVVVRRVVRRRRCDVFVEEGGKLVHRALMTDTSNGTEQPQQGRGRQSSGTSTPLGTRLEKGRHSLWISPRSSDA